MGRPELPVDHTLFERGRLAEQLRFIRMAARLNYDELADRTGLSPATLKRATSGRTVPAWETVAAFATACGDQPRLLHELWLNARIADRGRLAQLRQPARPQLIESRRELSAALEYFYEAAGAPPLRRLAALAGDPYLLPVSSAHRIVKRQALPVSRQQMVAFLTACGLTGQALVLWGVAFEEITRYPEGPYSRINALFEKVAEGTGLTRVRLLEGHQVVDGRGNPRFVRGARWTAADMRVAADLAAQSAAAAG
ncbi:helix-turn-helix domain-containing protein [Streptomyces erythrochromogenes]|uniref:helix-turn-helix domain-containing protein n=1 Tax=Streptomyces erythrochromogenes TaxID=285574 RepID=UPI0036350E9F